MNNRSSKQSMQTKVCAVATGGRVFARSLFTFFLSFFAFSDFGSFFWALDSVCVCVCEREREREKQSHVGFV